LSPATQTDVRRLVVEALDDASVAGARERPDVARFLDGCGDVALRDLAKDSLALMEFCIAIELATGLSLAPDELQRIGTLGNVADRLRELRA
jgi:hypothetical protein